VVGGGGGGGGGDDGGGGEDDGDSSRRLHVTCAMPACTTCLLALAPCGVV
jgi:hypothetical protein